MKRRLMLDGATRQLLDAAAESLAFRGGYLYGSSPTQAVRTALTWARDSGTAPNGARLEGASALKVDTAGIFDAYAPSQIAALLRDALLHYVANGAPGAGELAWRGRPLPLYVPRTLLPRVAVRAFAQRKPSELELAETLEDAMRRELSAMRLAETREGPLGGGETLLVPVRIDPALWRNFHDAAERAGYDADTLLWRGAREVRGA